MPELSRREAFALTGALVPHILAGGQRRRVSITIDDVAWSSIPAPFKQGASQQLMNALEQRGKARAALFVTGSNVDSAEGRAILQQWSAQGHALANHTWTHHVYNNSIEPLDFAADVLRCDKLVRSFPGFRPYFRFPALKEGGTHERRDFMRKFMGAYGYQNGSVTIDTSDWFYDRRLRTRLTHDPSFDVNQFREPYLAHIWNRAVYYDDLAYQVVGTSVRHTLLLHFNLINTLFLGAMLDMFRSRGWDVINAETAFGDPVFRRKPDTVPAGESLIWALAKETGRFDNALRYPGEDEVYEKPILDRFGL